MTQRQLIANFRGELPSVTAGTSVLLALEKLAVQGIFGNRWLALRLCAKWLRSLPSHSFDCWLRLALIFIAWPAVDTEVTILDSLTRARERAVGIVATYAPSRQHPKSCCVAKSAVRPAIRLVVHQ